MASRPPSALSKVRHVLLAGAIGRRSIPPKSLRNLGEVLPLGDARLPDCQNRWEYELQRSPISEGSVDCHRTLLWGASSVGRTLPIVALSFQMLQQRHQRLAGQRLCKSADEQQYVCDH